MASNVTVSCAKGEVGIVYDGALPFTRQTLDAGQPPAAAHPGHDERRQSGPGVCVWRCLPNDGVGLAREEFIISSAIQIHPLALTHFDSLPDGPAKEQDRQADPQLPEQAGLLRRPAGRGRRPDRRRLLPQGRDRPALRLQDQRVRRPARRRAVRAEGREPDDRLSRRLALLRRALPRGLPAGVPGHEEGARGDGADEREADGALLPHRRGGQEGPRRDGRGRAATRRERAGSLRHVRDSRRT